MFRKKINRLKHSKTILHQFGGIKNVGLQFVTTKEKAIRLTKFRHNEKNKKEHFTNLAKDTKLLKKLKYRYPVFFPNIITAYMWSDKLRIVLPKTVLYNSPWKIYEFLKKINS